jgi:hypothetical protein
MKPPDGCPPLQGGGQPSGLHRRDLDQNRYGGIPRMDTPRTEAFCQAPHGRWKTTTFLAALRHGRIEAPWFVEGPIGDDCFRLYVEKVHLPTLVLATSR